MNGPMHKRICEAMKAAGIEDAESQKGIDFCTQKCPYARCIVFEERTPSKYQIIKVDRVRRAKLLRERGFSVSRIATQLGVSKITAMRYLRQK